MSSDKNEHDSSPLLMLPVEICDLIFQHLTGELLTMSEVSPSFYNFVAGSKRCMRKIQMELKETRPPPSALMSSVRKYEHMKLYGGHVEASREILSVAGRTWKDICISRVDFETVNDFLDYLRVFQCSVEKLSLNQVYVNRNLDPRSELPRSDLQFPNLKSLEMICSFATFYDKAFINCKNLTSFSIKSGAEMEPSSLNAIRTVLKSNCGLRFLQISYEVFYLVFSEDFSNETSFKLKEFGAESLHRVLGNKAQVWRNFDAFLMNQSGTLETLTMGGWMGVDVLKTILSMPHLKDVTLMGFEGVKSVELAAADFPQNHSVSNLNFGKHLDKEVLRRILEAVPMLKSLNITFLDDAVVNTIAETCKFLRKLTVDFYDASRMTSGTFFKKLQHFHYRKFYGHPFFEPIV